MPAVQLPLEIGSDATIPVVQAGDTTTTLRFTNGALYVGTGTGDAWQSVGTANVQISNNIYTVTTPTYFQADYTVTNSFHLQFGQSGWNRFYNNTIQTYDLVFNTNGNHTWVSNTETCPVCHNYKHKDWKTVKATVRQEAGYKAALTAQRSKVIRGDVVARKLLFECLDDSQIAMFKAHNFFEVLTPSGHVYRIKWGRSWNIERIENNEVVEKMCAHIVPQLPNCDNLLAQKLSLETNEEGFVAMANKQKVVRITDLPKVTVPDYIYAVGAA